MTKPQFLASIRDPSNALLLEVSDDMKVHRFGDTAVVTGATHEKGKQNGKTYEHYGRFTDTWVKQKLGMDLYRQPVGAPAKIEKQNRPTTMISAESLESLQISDLLWR